MINQNSKIFLAGHNGLVGSAILRKLENKNYKKDIKAGGKSKISVDLLKKCLSSNTNELLTWQYIAKLIETDE